MQQKYRRGLVALVLAVVLGVVAVACTSQKPSQATGQAAENQQQAADTATLVNNQPLPHFPWSQIKQTLIEVETAQATSVQTTSFFFNQGVQDPFFVCPSIGFPIPNTASLSNPQQVQWRGGQYGNAAAVVSQQDPTGIYTPTSSSGTFAVCVGADGKAFAKYWEGFVDTVTGPAKWNGTTHQEEMIGTSSFAFTKSHP
jgi:hypothetical protein